ncbi:MAG: hypothetical protein ACLFT6_03835 [Bacteroidales bacterium]
MEFYFDKKPNSLSLISLKDFNETIYVVKIFVKDISNSDFYKDIFEINNNQFLNKEMILKIAKYKAQNLLSENNNRDTLFNKNIDAYKIERPSQLYPIAWVYKDFINEITNEINIQENFINELITIVNMINQDQNPR